MNKFEQSVYNTWLATNRQQKNMPYKLRKDFSKLDDESKNYVKNISSKLLRLKIPINEFFVAPLIALLDFCTPLHRRASMYP